jgi:protein SCO1
MSLKLGDVGAATSRHRIARVQLPLAALLTAFTLPARAAGDAPQPKPLVDASKLPEAGTYKLLKIQACPDGTVLTTEAKPVRLHSVLRGRVSVLSFMYTYCRDPLGCPLADRIMKELYATLKQDALLAAHAQLVSLSFDPTNDTPQQMKLYAGEYSASREYKWSFLTTSSVQYLMPLLNGLGQEVTVEVDAKGQPTRTLNHMLKLFLIDERLMVREIYSVTTASSVAMANDMKTVLMEKRLA